MYTMCVQWFRSYLANRRQKVGISPRNQHDESFSNWEIVKNGIPQGSILGPVLFIIYINDLSYGFKHWAIPVLYADDTSVLITANTINELQTKFNYYMNAWFTDSGLSLNTEKTNIVKFSSYHLQDHSFCINFQNKIMKEANNIKFLGLELDKHMNWKSHIGKILPKMSSACYVIRSMYHLSNKTTLKMRWCS
jgi:mannose/fructose/N-acetylgalactosamine-specific phosphotransferase system component IID